MQVPILKIAKIKKYIVNLAFSDFDIADMKGIFMHDIKAMIKI
jgi:hypothetical protein